MGKIDESNNRLQRDVYIMSSDIKKVLEKGKVLKDYFARPHYQQNDYLGWILRAKREETRLKRINLMVSELKKGGVYMGMKHSNSKKKV